MSFNFNIARVAHLARISVTSEEVAIIQPRLQSIMHMIDELEKIDTSGVKPMVNPLDSYQRQRADLVTETDHHKPYQALAPQVAADLYLVPQVIEE